MSSPEDTCTLVRLGGVYEGRWDASYRLGLTDATSNARTICMQVTVLPPGARTRAHLHRRVETAVYVVEGQLTLLFGSDLHDCLVARAGDFIHVPGGIPHRLTNEGQTPATFVVAHSASNDEVNIVLLPCLDTRIPDPSDRRI